MARIPSPMIAKRQDERMRQRQLRTKRRTDKLTALTGEHMDAKAMRYIAIHADPSMFNAIVALLQSLHHPTTPSETQP